MPSEVMVIVVTIIIIRTRIPLNYLLMEAPPHRYARVRRAVNLAGYILLWKRL